MKTAVSFLPLSTRLLDWPDDVAEVADHLGPKHFTVEGFSAGGPCALACTARIPQRLTACSLISTISPLISWGKLELCRRRCPLLPRRA
ncbi:MAG: alpha/beta fold hydrolase [Thermogemmatispora sp.]|uniref:alpha/beta fold hydrolase n=1 Tax=Thermogemmatispora TaxID=768669 RepID=UPI001478401D|nr:alpha/beta fold hydrolase [Thermogemmatispora sp.]